jgi:hypothetical protein
MSWVATGYEYNASMILTMGKRARRVSCDTYGISDKPSPAPFNVPTSSAGVQEVIVAQGAGSSLQQRIGSKQVFETTELSLDRI